MLSYNKYVSQELMRLRKLNEMSVPAVSLATGFSSATVDRLESGGVAITVMHLDKFAAVYKVQAFTIVQNATLAREQDMKRPREAMQ